MASYVTGKVLSHALAAGYNSGALSASTVGSVVRGARPFYTTGGRAVQSALAAGMARRFKRKLKGKGAARPSKRRRVVRKQRSSLIGQYQQRTGRNYGARRRRASSAMKRFKSCMFKLLPTKTLIITNMPGGSDNDQGFFGDVTAYNKCAWSWVSMYGSAGLDIVDGSFTGEQDTDLWSLYKQYYAEGGAAPTDPGVGEGKAYNNIQFYIVNSHVSATVTWDPKGLFTSSPAEVTFYLVEPRKSQRAAPKDVPAITNFGQKFSNYFTEDWQPYTTSGTTAFNEVNPKTTWDVTPFDSRVFCREWVVRSSKTMVVQNGSSCSFEQSVKSTRKVIGSDLDEYDYIKGVYYAILVKVKPLSTSFNGGTTFPARIRYKKTYNYKVIESSNQSSTVAVHQTTGSI